MADKRDHGVLANVSRETREYIEWQHEDKIGNVYSKTLDAKEAQESAKAKREEAKAIRSSCMAISQKAGTLTDLISKYNALDANDPNTPVLKAYYQQEVKDTFGIELQ